MIQLSSNNLAFVLRSTASNILNSSMKTEFNSAYFAGTDKADKMLEVLQNCANQLGVSILEDSEVYQIAINFFDNFAFTNDWMDRAEEVTKQHNQQNKVG
jgi:hypothetical protein